MKIFYNFLFIAVLLFISNISKAYSIPSTSEKPLKKNFYQLHISSLSSSIFTIFQEVKNNNKVLSRQKNTVCQVVSDLDYKVELNSLVSNQDGSISYSFNITLYSDRALSHVRFELPYLLTAQSPAHNNTFNGTRNNFNIENPSSNGFWNINFETLGEGIKNGQTETLEYTLPNGAPILDSITVELKYANTYQIFKISTLNCSPSNCNGFSSLGTINLFGGACENILINSNSQPTGGTGTIEYRWQQRTFCNGNWSEWQTVIGENGENYQSGPVFKNSEFRRQARRTPCVVWENSNVVVVGGCDICGNGLDDDCDNLVDNYDTDCPCYGAGVPNINFDIDALGQPVLAGDVPYEYWAAWGVHISSNDLANHAPMIFDSENPTGGNFDLGTRNETYGGVGKGMGGESGRPGANTQLFGKALIISADNNSDAPNDNDGGGTLIFEFDSDMDIASVEIVDVDYGETGGRIKIYNGANTLLNEYPIIAYGDNSYQKIAIQTTGIRKMEVSFPGSGSLTALNFCDANLPTSSIGDLVWFDENHNGNQDDGETGLSGAVVELYDKFGNLLGKETTDNTGLYQFNNLVNDDYIVKITPPTSEYRCTKDLDGNRDSDSEVFTLSTTRNDIDFGFGLIEVCNNGVDDDNDGLVDGDDPDCCTNLQVISQAAWSLHYVDSEETAGDNNAATKAFDGNINTFWHTEWSTGNAPMPHEIQIDLGATYTIAGLRYLPRQDGGTNGRISNFEIYISTDGNSWGNSLVSGTWTYSDNSEKEISFQTTSGRYVRLRATAEANGNPWAAAAEINILECSNTENCSNGMDDDGDGAIDMNDSDCGCAETVIYIARDNGQILEFNINTGATQVATTSPYTSSNLNALAANPDAGIVYYGRGKNVYYWNPITDTHGQLVNLSGQIGSNESFTSGGGAYYDGYIYMGSEDDGNSWYPKVYRIPVSADGLSVTGNAQNLNIPIQYNSSWGDMIATGENGNTVIYGALGAGSNQSIYFKYTIETASYTLLRSDLPREMQIGVDVNGEIWGGGLRLENLQRFSKQNGNFYGNIVSVSNWMWDLTGPINCPQTIEICFNGIDDDGDGLVDCDDPDCSVSLYGSTNIPINISSASTGTYTSTLNVTESETIQDLNVSDLSITHSYIDDLKLTLTSPSGTMVTLIEKPCNSENDIYMCFDDDAATSAYPCPPTNGNKYRPSGNLSDFDGENMQGLWMLSITDDYAQSGGSLNRWSLEFTKTCSIEETCGNGIDDDGDGRIDEECSPCKLEDMTNCGLQIHPSETEAVTDINSEIPAGECAPTDYFDLTPYDLFNNNNQSYELCVAYNTEDHSRIGVKNLIVQNALCTDGMLTYTVTEVGTNTTATFVGQDINGTSLGLQYFDVNPNTAYRICVSIAYNNTDLDCENPRVGQNDPEICSTTFHVFPIGQAEICDNNIDDDLDGLVDCLDPDCGGSSTGYVVAVAYQTGVGNASNAIGTLDGSYAQIYDTGDRLTLDLGHTLAIGESYTIVWRRKSSYTNTATADMVIEESADNSTFTQQPVEPATSQKSSFISTTITANSATRYIRLREKTGSNDDLEVDGVSYSISCNEEICGNGIDDDGDGLMDCDDPECGFTSIDFSTTPVSCANGGSVDLTVNSAYTPHSYIWSDVYPDAHYTFENNTDDISGNNHHNNGITGTLGFSTDAIEGKNALELDGSNSVRYSIDGGFMEVPFNQLSILFWIKPANLTGRKMLFEEGGGTNGIVVQLNENSLEAAVRTGGASSETNPGAHTFPNDGAWHHVALIYNNGEISLYLDGVSNSRDTAIFQTVLTHGSNGGIGDDFNGCATGSCGNNYVGLMDDFRYFFEKALTENQVEDIATNNGDRTGLKAGTYAVTISNSNGCSSIENITITAEINHVEGLEVNVITDGADTNPGDGICDDGECNCSLRAAMEEANALAGYDTITFNIPGSGPHIIQPFNDLPSITEGVFIDGLSQTGSNAATIESIANLKIGVNGSNMASAKGIFHTIADNTIFKGLTINGYTCTSTSAGITLESNHNTIAGNFIGIDINGTTVLPNSTGISIIGGNNNTIGGALLGDRNIISGNTENGISLENNGSTVADNNLLQNNFIGTSPTGKEAMGNGTNGVDNGQATNTTILSNIIAANGNDGIEISGTNSGNMATGVIIQDNKIGTGYTGSEPLGNGFRGVFMEYASNNLIGGVQQTEVNVIANNMGAAIEIIKEESNQNVILKNQIYFNGGIGIDLANGANGDGVTLNDVNDTDNGANNYLNYPQTASFIINGDSIEYDLGVDVPSGFYRIEFFNNNFTDPSGHGEGHTFVHAEKIAHNGDGMSQYLGVFEPEEMIVGGQHISMTLTKCTDSNCTDFVETSEFSAWIEVNDCINYTDAGVIGGAEENCTSYDPGIISGIILPSGGSGAAAAYIWQKSQDDSTWTTISGAIFEVHDPPTITQSTWFRRGVKRSTCSEFIYSNTVKKEVIYNVTSAGTISGEEVNCGGFDPSEITSVTLGVGGVDGILQYQWQKSSDNGQNWEDIEGENAVNYNPEYLSQTTYYKRAARRYPCLTWINSNIIVKTVKQIPLAEIAEFPVGDNGFICEDNIYDFTAKNVGTSVQYTWDFGNYASLSIATGPGPHKVSFQVPDETAVSTITIRLTTNLDGCIQEDTKILQIKPNLSISSIIATDPTNCFSFNANGSIDINPYNPSSSDFQISINGGVSWGNVNQQYFSALSNDNYDIWIRYDNGDCPINHGVVTLSEPSSPLARISESATDVCLGEAITFVAADSATWENYSWDFGEGASPRTKDGKGPHTINYTSPGVKNVQLNVTQFFCSAVDNSTVTIVDNFTDGGEISGSEIVCDAEIPSLLSNITFPSGGNYGTVEYQWEKRTLQNSGEWSSWEEINKAITFNYAPLIIETATEYRRKSRQKPCNWVYSNVVSKGLSTKPILKDDLYPTACPGFIYADNVADNDENLVNPTFYIHLNPANGTLDLDQDGAFIYRPNSTFCGSDQFVYVVCNQNSACCDTATAILDLSDLKAPDLLNIPENITLHCDDEIPNPPLVQAWENCQSVTIGLEEESTLGIDSCAINNYILTRTWTGIDYCGNYVSDQQTLTILDETAPDIFRIYTLPNGKKVVAGVMENVTQYWKTIRFPIQFSSRPVVLAQVISNNDFQAVTPKLRNVSTSQFQLHIQEEEMADDVHAEEKVAWIAMEEGVQSEDVMMEIQKAIISSASTKVDFLQSYTQAPLIFGNLQSFNEKDPCTFRHDSISTDGITGWVQEEKSRDDEVSHGLETAGLLVYGEPGDIKNNNGEVFGEVGKMVLNNSLKTIDLKHTYHNPVVILGNLSNGDPAPATVRVVQVSQNNFQVFIQEWNYLDGVHGSEAIGYMVVEGSIPFDRVVDCKNIPAALDIGTEIIAVDNCDNTVFVSLVEDLGSFGCMTDTIMTRIWSSIDECGNYTSFTQQLTLLDTIAPDFTVPGNLFILCSEDINDVSLTGDVTDETDNCSSNIAAEYEDDLTFQDGCSGYILRNWRLIDNCGNVTTKIQTIYLYKFQSGDRDYAPDAIDLDDDNDGIPDVVETTNDTDGDGIPNYLDLDSDNDGIPDLIEMGGIDANGDGLVDNIGEIGWDKDQDGFADGYDTDDYDASELASTQRDYTDETWDQDQDGIPNYQDLDSDNDGIPDLIEVGGVDINGDGQFDYPNPGDPTSLLDGDGDGFVDEYDPDDDGLLIVEDAFNPLLLVREGSILSGNPSVNPDLDEDGIANYLDLDSDNDGIPDLIEVGGVDTDGNGIIDEDEFIDADKDGFNDEYAQNPLILTEDDGDKDDGRPEDIDGDGTPYINADEDKDGLLNSLDIDADEDGIFDVLETGNRKLDKDENGFLDTVLDENKDGLDDKISQEGGITTETDGSLDDGKPEDSNDANESAYNSSVLDGTFGSTNTEPDVDDDGDGLLNFLDVDSDGDGILDKFEDRNFNGFSDTYETDYLNPDSDGDNIPDGVEDANQNGIREITETNPLNRDSDGDTYEDGIEDINFNGVLDLGESNPIDPCDPVFGSKCFGISLNIRVKLQGALINGDENGLMRDDLRARGLIPFQEPYSDIPHLHQVGEGGNEYIDSDILAITGNNAMVDWVLIEIRSDIQKDSIIATRSGILQRDGDVVDLDGGALNFFQTPSGNYHVAVRHRNHLGIITRNSYFLSPSPTLIDFIDDATLVYGNFAINDRLGERAMWSGDMNGDRKVIFQGPDNDIFDLFLDIIVEEENDNSLDNFIAFGYLNTDLDLDGLAIYQGPNNDKSKLVFNVILETPANDNLYVNFVVAEKLPELINNTNTNPCFFGNRDETCDFDNDGIINSIDQDDDNDGVKDVNDVHSFSKSSDSDGDGLSDDFETRGDGKYDVGIDTNPLAEDTDNDLLPDGMEDANLNRQVDQGETDPLNPDTDGDGFNDGQEDNNQDGELNNGESNPVDRCNPNKVHPTCDFDGDGYINYIDLDDDDDGVADIYDVNPFNVNSDSDGDGYSDHLENGKDGVFHPMTDSNPLDACDPDPYSGDCIGIDTDGDGYYSNFPLNHNTHDPNDKVGCIPNPQSAACSCPDLDGDGYITICHTSPYNPNIVESIVIPVSQWDLHAAHGDTCGFCDN